MVCMSDYTSSIIRFLEGCNQPTDTESIRRNVGIGNWSTARGILLEMVIAGDIKGLKTSKSWVFWRDGTLEEVV